MPFSSHSGKDFIKSLDLNAKTVLDVGAGCGTYRNMFPTLGKHWTALEVWQPYVDKYNLRNKYDVVIVEDLRTWQPKQKYDICFCGDILEHMTEKEAVQVLNKLREIATTVIISIPIGYYPQDEYEGNPYEIHVEDHWTHERFLKSFGTPYQYNLEKEIGVYVFKKLKIAVYAIAKNEEQFVQRFCDSAKDADLILIADTGSTDNTVNKAIECGAIVHDVSINPWRFDTARNVSLSLVPSNFDICIALDLDETLVPRWRDEVERVWLAGTTQMRYRLDFGSGITYYHDKIHSRNGYQWVYPIHEYIQPDKRITVKKAHSEMVLVEHKPDRTKSRLQYFDLLKMAVQDDPYTPRHVVYLAREHTYHAQWAEAIPLLEKYLKMPEATWVDERCFAMRLLGKCNSNLGKNDESLKWHRLAVIEDSHRRETWVDLAWQSWKMALWPECYGAALSALAIKVKKSDHTMDVNAWGATPHDLASVAAWHLNHKEQAKQQVIEALKLAPNDQRLLDHQKMMNADSGLRQVAFN
jgi:glycosyltransferase involved in cell wall biosynthesis